mgnify:CR=1 FL=1
MFGGFNWYLHSKRLQSPTNTCLQLYLKVLDEDIGQKDTKPILTVLFAVRINGEWHHKEIQTDNLIFGEKSELLLCSLTEQNSTLKEKDNDFLVSIKIGYLYSGLLNNISHNFNKLSKNLLIINSLTFTDLCGILSSLPEVSSEVLNFARIWSICSMSIFQNFRASKSWFVQERGTPFKVAEVI